MAERRPDRQGEEILGLNTFLQNNFGEKMTYTFNEVFGLCLLDHRRKGQIAYPRVAQLSPSIVTFGYPSGGPLGFVYDADVLRLRTESYTPEINEYHGRSVGFIDPAAFSPDITDFDDALRIAQELFEAICYETPSVIRDVRQRATTQS